MTRGEWLYRLAQLKRIYRDGWVDRDTYVQRLVALVYERAAQEGAT